eukprot:169831-Pyramimonas_sp.AAC.1
MPLQRDALAKRFTVTHRDRNAMQVNSHCDCNAMRLQCNGGVNGAAATGSRRWHTGMPLGNMVQRRPGTRPPGRHEKARANLSVQTLWGT